MVALAGNEVAMVRRRRRRRRRHSVTLTLTKSIFATFLAFGDFMRPFLFEFGRV